MKSPFTSENCKFWDKNAVMYCHQNPVGFVMDKVALGQAFSEFFGFLLSTSFNHGSPCSYITWRMNNSPVGGSSSETYSHPIDMIIIVLIISTFIDPIYF
jgi:hypothetical protein